MNKKVILYWAKGGNVEKAAGMIYEVLADEGFELYDLGSFKPESAADYDFLILGGATIGAESWEDATADNMWNQFFRKTESIDFSNKTLAFFGLGDQVLYPDHFVDGLGVFQEEFEKRNTKIVGQWPIEGYRFTDSDGFREDHFFGLALDLDQEPEVSRKRIDDWVKTLRKYF